MSKWKLVEAEVAKKEIEGTPISSMRPTAHNPQFEGNKVLGKGVRKRRSSRAFGNIRNRSSSIDDYGLEEDEAYQHMSKEDLAYATHIACTNIEYLFSTDSLVVNGDLYLRSLMDSDGFVPLAYILQYPDLMYSPASAEEIGEMLHQNEKSPLEVDLVNSTVRLKENWAQFLLPNDSGGMGLSQRWIKSGTSDPPSPARPVKSEPIPLTQSTESHEQTRERTLSAAAKEFVSSSPVVASSPMAAMASSPLRANAFEFVPKA